VKIITFPDVNIMNINQLSGLMVEHAVIFCFANKKPISALLYNYYKA